jgi:hypothetical protein
MSALSEWYVKSLAAGSAAKRILGIRPRDAVQGRSGFTFDPATGALKISPDLDRKIRKTLRRAARRITFRLLLRQPRFEIEHLALKVRHAGLRLFRELAGDLSKPSIRHDDVRSLDRLATPRIAKWRAER